MEEKWKKHFNSRWWCNKLFIGFIVTHARTRRKNQICYVKSLLHSEFGCCVCNSFFFFLLPIQCRVILAINSIHTPNVFPFYFCLLDPVTFAFVPFSIAFLSRSVILSCDFWFIERRREIVCAVWHCLREWKIGIFASVRDNERSDPRPHSGIKIVSQLSGEQPVKAVRNDRRRNSPSERLWPRYIEMREVYNIRGIPWKSEKITNSVNYVTLLARLKPEIANKPLNYGLVEKKKCFCHQDTIVSRVCMVTTICKLYERGFELFPRPTTDCWLFTDFKKALQG